MLIRKIHKRKVMVKKGVENKKLRNEMILELFKKFQNEYIEKF